MTKLVDRLRMLHRPRWLRIDSLLLWGGVLGLVTGSFLTWLINKQPTPWMEFPNLVATYRTGDLRIEMRGNYVVHFCRRPNQVIWRAEAIALDGQIAVYGPTPEPPNLTRGEYEFVRSIPLEEQIYPDGWQVRVIVTCPGETPETVASPPAPVQIVE